MKIEYKGHKVYQDPESHHVVIFDGEGKRVFHSQASGEKTAEELKETVDFYLMLCEKMPEM